jgi:hypothetical protein
VREGVLDISMISSSSVVPSSSSTSSSSPIRNWDIFTTAEDRFEDVRFLVADDAEAGEAYLRIAFGDPISLAVGELAGAFLFSGDELNGALFDASDTDSPVGAFCFEVECDTGADFGSFDAKTVAEVLRLNGECA